MRLHSVVLSTFVDKMLRQHQPGLANKSHLNTEPFDTLAHPQVRATDSLDAANDFIAGNDHRKHVFGNEFNASDLNV